MAHLPGDENRQARLEVAALLGDEEAEEQIDNDRVAAVEASDFEMG